MQHDPRDEIIKALPSKILYLLLRLCSYFKGERTKVHGYAIYHIGSLISFCYNVPTTSTFTSSSFVEYLQKNFPG
ncbi:hypothetical protein RIR_jg32459.t1 [Rhizophagus irregularis DAOM 181602=DAOM 197198]|nr:hypothetical protein RIR_jg32459.t1 [Rhizophagus irregularis DAOM 181602=DAOM 197198]